MDKRIKIYLRKNIKEKTFKKKLMNIETKILEAKNIVWTNKKYMIF